MQDMPECGGSSQSDRHSREFRDISASRSRACGADGLIDARSRGFDLSLKNMTEDMEVSFDVLKRWLGTEGVYYLFEIKPYSRRVRAEKHPDGKLYIWDYSTIRTRRAVRNLVAASPLKPATIGRYGEGAI